MKYNLEAPVSSNWIAPVIIIGFVILATIVSGTMYRLKIRKRNHYQNVSMIISDFEKESFKKQIDRHDFTLLEQIGSGNFGTVHTGKLNGEFENILASQIAVKTVSGFATEKEISDFLNEIKIMGQLKPNLNTVNMIASCTSELEKQNKLWLLIEYCAHGDLKAYLSKHRESLSTDDSNSTINNRLLVLWPYDIAKGMQFLAKNQIMHGDLAARNILICDDPLACNHPLAKVSDFGLSKKFYDNIKYKKETRLEIPWKWMALEYFRDDFFTLTSDVWSFAVVVWEILSLGRSPYGLQGYDEVLEQLENGYRLPCPREAIEISTWQAEDFYKRISNACFESDPLRRADFSQVVSIIHTEMTGEELIRYNEMQKNIMIRLIQTIMYTLNLKETNEVVLIVSGG